MGAETPKELKEKLDRYLNRVETGWNPPIELPKRSVIEAKERLIIDFGNHEELVHRLHKAQKVLGFDNAPAWKAVEVARHFPWLGQAEREAGLYVPRTRQPIRQYGA